MVGPPKQQSVLSSGDLPRLFIPFWIFSSKNVHCAVVAGHADEGRVLIEVNAAERPAGISSMCVGKPSPALSWRLPPQPSLLQAEMLRTTPPLTSPRGSQPRNHLESHRRSILGC